MRNGKGHSDGRHWRAFAALTIALLGTLAWAAPAASADEASTIILRCARGESLAGFGADAYVTALRELPPIVKEYTDCERLIWAAALGAAVPPPTVPPTPAPVLGGTEIAKLVSGKVTARVKGTHEFVAVGASTALPDGSEVDTTRGRVSIAAATPRGGVQNAEVSGGLFVIHQTRAGAGETRFTLSQSLAGCRSAPTARAGHPRGPRSRRIWVSEHGGAWGTNGRYASTSAAGARWLTLDECARSVVEVAAGSVKVRDLLGERTRTLTAGRSYAAGPAARRRRR